jgi:hypothetical protein
VRDAAEARQAAARALADSGATVAELRDQLTAVIAASRADSMAQANDRAATGRTIAAMQAALAADSVERSRSTAAINALITRAVTAEREVTLLKQDRGSTFWTVVKLAGAGVAGYSLGRVGGR